MKINDKEFCAEAVSDYLRSNVEGDEVIQVVFNEEGINIDFKSGISVLIPESSKDVKVINNCSIVKIHPAKQQDIEELFHNDNIGNPTVNYTEDCIGEDGTIQGTYVTYEVERRSDDTETGIKSYLKIFLYKIDGKILCGDMY